MKCGIPVCVGVKAKVTTVNVCIAANQIGQYRSEVSARDQTTNNITQSEMIDR